MIIFLMSFVSAEATLSCSEWTEALDPDTLIADEWDSAKGTNCYLLVDVEDRFKDYEIGSQGNRLFDVVTNSDGTWELTTPATWSFGEGNDDLLMGYIATIPSTTQIDFNGDGSITVELPSDYLMQLDEFELVSTGDRHSEFDMKLEWDGRLHRLHLTLDDEQVDFFSEFGGLLYINNYFLDVGENSKIYYDDEDDLVITLNYQEEICNKENLAEVELGFFTVLGGFYNGYYVQQNKCNTDVILRNIDHEYFDGEFEIESEYDSNEIKITEYMDEERKEAIPFLFNDDDHLIIDKDEITDEEGEVVGYLYEGTFQVGDNSNTKEQINICGFYPNTAVTTLGEGTEIEFQISEEGECTFNECEFRSNDDELKPDNEYHLKCLSDVSVKDGGRIADEYFIVFKIFNTNYLRDVDSLQVDWTNDGLREWDCDGNGVRGCMKSMDTINTEDGLDEGKINFPTATGGSFNIYLCAANNRIETVNGLDDIVSFGDGTYELDAYTFTYGNVRFGLNFPFAFPPLVGQEATLDVCNDDKITVTGGHVYNSNTGKRYVLKKGNNYDFKFSNDQLYEVDCCQGKVSNSGVSEDNIIWYGCSVSEGRAGKKFFQDEGTYMVKPAEDGCEVVIEPEDSGEEEKVETSGDSDGDGEKEIVEKVDEEEIKKGGANSCENFNPGWGCGCMMESKFPASIETWTASECDGSPDCQRGLCNGVDRENYYCCNTGETTSEGSEVSEEEEIVLEEIFLLECVEDSDCSSGEVCSRNKCVSATSPAGTTGFSRLGEGEELDGRDFSAFSDPERFEKTFNLYGLNECEDEECEVGFECIDNYCVLLTTESLLGCYADVDCDDDYRCCLMEEICGEAGYYQKCVSPSVYGDFVYNDLISLSDNGDTIEGDECLSDGSCSGSLECCSNEECSEYEEGIFFNKCLSSQRYIKLIAYEGITGEVAEEVEIINSCLSDADCVDNLGWVCCDDLECELFADGDYNKVCVPETSYDAIMRYAYASDEIDEEIVVVEEVVVIGEKDLHCDNDAVCESNEWTYACSDCTCDEDSDCPTIAGQELHCCNTVDCDSSANFNYQCVPADYLDRIFEGGYSGSSLETLDNTIQGETEIIIDNTRSNYEGWSVDGKMEGEGTFTLDDGRVYTGNFVDDHPNSDEIAKALDNAEKLNSLIEGWNVFGNYDEVTELIMELKYLEFHYLQDAYETIYSEDLGQRLASEYSGEKREKIEACFKNDYCRL